MFTLTKIILISLTNKNYFEFDYHFMPPVKMFNGRYY